MSYICDVRVLALARHLICSKYKNIINIRCIAYCYNLISKDILQYIFANRIVQFFKKSHIVLKEKIKQYEISGGGLKTYIETRWITVHKCIFSIIRLKNCLEEIRDNHPKNAILAVETANSTLADPYINFIKIAAVIQNLPIDEYKGFCNYYIKKFNFKFKEFNDPAYQLTFFLHSAYKGVGLKFGVFLVIANFAGELW
ncbi:hypothetical protein RhiirA4_459907 [Rhizophagus irregularis]|uniref:Uncharacterized protein n=1 Tax=Rhizophagus irregularis TaxID=588596 RepID=A0A2I1GFD5_9GLOM|nr:hypothetical protein RhiirA4_459907 [Rhizophagus irregularis]